jgi:hypothetical protein
MPINRCEWLAKNGIEFQCKLDTRNGMAGRIRTDAELRFAEYELIRMTRMITKHRRRCPKCRLNDESVGMGQLNLRPLPSESGVVISTQVH